MFLLLLVYPINIYYTDKLVLIGEPLFFNIMKRLS